MARSSDRGAMRAVAGSRGLRIEDFTFVGFGELRRDERRKVLRLGIRSGEPDIAAVDGAVFVPGDAMAGDGQARFTGGIVGPGGEAIAAAQMHRKGGKQLGGTAEGEAPAPQQEIDEDVVYLGPLFNHYGRVLLESLARVWVLDRLAPSVKVVFTHANAAQAALAPWVAELLSLFGIPPGRMLKLDVPTRVRRAIVPEPLFEQFYSAHVMMAAPFRDVAAGVADDAAPSGQPLYLSRRRLSSRQRPIIGEPELEEALRRNGFRIAHPETMPIAEQIRLINSHADIVSTLGSAAHSILFALHAPRLHLLTSRDDIPANFFLCSALADAPTTFVDCMGAGGRATANDARLDRRAISRGAAQKSRPVDNDAGPQSMPQLVDFARVGAYLTEQGLLTEPSSFPMATPAAPLQDRFDEAWLYARVRKASNNSTLPEAIEAEAIARSTSSWPLSLMLARYYARARDAAGADAMANQFAALVAAETDAERLAHHFGDVRSQMSRIARNCQPGTRDRLTVVIASRFPDADGGIGPAEETD